MDGKACTDATDGGTIARARSVTFAIESTLISTTYVHGCGCCERPQLSYWRVVRVAFVLLTATMAVTTAASAMATVSKIGAEQSQPNKPRNGSGSESI